MIWNKPKSIWGWLAPLSPGAVSLAMTAFGKLCLSPDNEVAPAVLGLPVALILCAVVAYRLTRGTGGAGKVLGLTLLFTFALALVNISIALGGCAVMNPHMDFK